MANISIGMDSMNKTQKFEVCPDGSDWEHGGHNICLGWGAGLDITDESYQFCLALSPEGPECRTVMTPEEFEVVNAVVRRALENKTERVLTWQT